MQDFIASQLASFIVGILSSLAFAGILLLRPRLQLRLRFRSVLRLISELAHMLRADGYSPEYIVTIDRNSGVVGSILAGNLGTRGVVSVAAVHLRLPEGTRQSRLDELSVSTLSLLEGARILVLICCNGTGTSLKLVLDRLESLGPRGPKEVRTAAIYTSASPIVIPTYAPAKLGPHSHKTMDDIVSSLPWITKDWVHQLGGERIRRA